MARIECAVQVEPVGREDVKIMILAVVLAARQIDEEVVRVVVVARIGAELRANKRRSGRMRPHCACVSARDGPGGSRGGVGFPHSALVVDRWVPVCSYVMCTLWGC